MEAIFEKLYSLQLVANAEGDALPLDLPLTPEAKDAWIAFYNDHAREQEELTGDLAATWSKLEGYAARLALVVHLVRWAAGDTTLNNSNVINQKSIQAGVELSRWFGHEACRVYVILGESTEQREHRRLVELVQRKGGSVTVRQVMRSTQMFTNAKDVEEALNGLVEAWHGTWETPPPGATGGHPTRWFVLTTPVDVDTTPILRPLSEVSSMSTASTGLDSPGQ